MSLGECDVAVHAYMYLYGKVLANASGTQVVWCDDAFYRKDCLDNLIFNLFWQGVLQEFFKASRKNLKSDFCNEETDYYGSYRVQNMPIFSKENGTGNSQKCANG